MTERQMQLRIGALVLVAILLFMGFVLSIGRRSALFEDRYSLWTSFSSTEGLTVGAPVRLAGVTVGNVTRVAFGRDPKDRRIILTLTVEQRVRDRIREDSVASIGTIGLVGDKVLDITVGSFDRPPLAPGAQLASVDPPDYSRLLQKGDRILDNVTRITASLDEFLAGGESAGKRNFSEALRSLRTTLVEVEKGEGLLHDVIYGKEGAQLLGRLDRTVLSLERLAKAIESGDGLLHALVYAPQGETLGRLNQALANLEDLLREAKEGRGLLHALIYEPQGAELLARLNRTGEELEKLVREAREGKGLIPSLLFDPAGAKVLEEVQAAATALRALTADLQVVTTRLRQGEGTIGGLLEDPTVYEDLSALLRGANRSWVLRSLIRATREDGARKEP
ncbi:MAG: MCE family protein [candidate division NC10 bacterium]|nr:MCE family protein [candidate division NC10 bacterium]MBI3086591.1 MCE family protein [candidate division NC10 bacterium]